MKIIHISDTHGCHRCLPELPEADIIVHSGDFTTAGSELEASWKRSISSTGFATCPIGLRFSSVATMTTASMELT